MSKQRTKRQKAIIKRRIFVTLCALILISAIALITFCISAIIKPSENKQNTDSDISSGQASDNSSEAEIPETTATVLSTGDIMVHSTQLTGAKTADGYDFTAFFKESAPYFQAADLAIANLEVTFGGSESGTYSGYPAFNTPDSLADAIKASGLNLLLTSNNHSYDTGLYGLKRTVQILKQKGIDFTGTKETETDPTYVVKEINGIKIGIANFTYETDGQIAGRKYLNGAIISEEANPLINSFSYKRLDEFYSNVQSILSGMESDGADFKVFYIHWGNEYQFSPSTWQKSIAQNLSNFGVNMIIGSHPHVVQPVELIHSEDGQNTTVCLYSTGNYVSNQRQELMSPECTTGHTEDGVFFTFTLTKNKDGTDLTGLDLIPTWVDKYKGGENGGYLYTVYPLESPDDAVSKYSLSQTSAEKAKKSYERTKEIVAAGLTECQQSIGCEITFEQ